MTTTTAPVVVGVAASTVDDDNALRFAAGAAERRGAPLVLLHTYNPESPATHPLISKDVRRNVGQEILAEASDRLAAIPDTSVEVKTQLVEGRTVGVLLAASEGASLLVLRRQDLSSLERVFTGSIIMGVAARAACPVVSVPAGWDAGVTRGRVLVGLDDSSISPEALDVAFALAEERGAALTVLHAWRSPGFYSDVIFARTSEETWRKETREHLEKTLAPWSERHRGVTVDVRVEYERPATALARASSAGDVLVVGRRTRPLPRGLALGSVTRALVASARCPLIVAPHPGDEAPGEDGADG
ncbi:universal stress protein [Mumia zhuanghuii]|uniref:Universal stress protein n=1 Tax=Mumia zhuanghuii TaxID=2585211 RepID=A0A5C4MXC3_9ACTN|nr:universal stress protein [Mumia zhuanghuii]TNC47568.1 universal stress protein [Mumia zhuanghuii]TNC50258.1 universal stress protein [Mumia zhuanghuii]